MFSLSVVYLVFSIKKMTSFRRWAMPLAGVFECPNTKCAGLLTGTHKDSSGAFRGPDDTVTEERIQHILTEASRAMTSSTATSQAGQQDQDSRSTDSKSPASSTHSPR